MKLKNLQLFFWLAGVFVLVAVLIPKVSAAPLDQSRDYLNRNKQSLTSGVTHEFVIKPTTNIGTTANQVVVVFPDGDDGTWCHDAGSDLTVTTTNLHDSASALPGGSLSASCTKGSGALNYDTITISGVGSLSNATTYGVRVADGSTAKLGTPANTTTGVVTIKTNNGSTDIDSSNIVLDIVVEDTVTVTGTINSAMTFAIDDTDIGFGNMDPGNIRYATADGVGANSSAPQGDPVQLSASTNADDGLVIEVRSQNANSTAGLYSADATTTLAAVASTDVSAGSEEFGVYGKHATGAGMTIAEGFDNDTTSDEAVDTTFKTFASINSPTTGVTVDLQPMAGITATTPAGTYVTTITLVATGRF
jgi:hypothetical protein